MSELANILVVEDDSGTRLVLTTLLELEGYKVIACEDAEAALKYIVAKKPLELVLSDLRLPDGTGLEILWALKKINSDIVFILTTAHASIETAMKAVNEGAYDYHVKPLDIDAVKQAFVTD